MHLIFKILCFSLLFLEGSFELVLECTGMTSADTAVINENDFLLCKCTEKDHLRGDIIMEMEYVRVAHAQEPPRNDSIGEFHERKNKKMKLFTNPRVSYGDAGLYICSYVDESVSVYLWVKSYKRWFVTREPEEAVGVLYRSHIKVGCVPTSPCFDVKLFQGSKEIAVNETNGILFDAREGFTITNPSYIYTPTNFTCSITVGYRTDTTSFVYTKFGDE